MAEPTDAVRVGCRPRRFLPAGAGSLGGLAATTGLSGCGTVRAVGLADGQLAPGTVNGWNLLGGGDGVRRQTMEEAYRATHPPTSLRAATFTWGNPYDTKVSLATVAGAPPDAAVVHLTRASNLAEAVLLTENTADMLHLVGLTAGHFSPRTWRQQLDGRSYAVPLDHHPVLPTYNTELRRLRSVPSGRHKSPYRSSRSA